MSSYRFIIGGKTYDVTVNNVAGGKASVEVNGKAYEVEIPAAEGASPAPAAQTPAAAETRPVPAPEAPAAKRAAAPAPAAGSAKICSPLPGVIIDVCVTPGQSVKAGDKVAVLEAMKMENDILAEKDGVVASVHVSKGDSVLEGADIVTLQ